MTSASTANQAQKSPVFRNVTCPFCGLLCDDLVVKRRATQLSITANGCPKASAGFEKTLGPSSPRIDGKDATLADAIARAASLLKRAKRPMYGGLATDVAGMRAVMELAEKTAGIVDHMHGDAMMRNILTVQEQGWIMTTVTEVRNRADLIIFVGTDASVFPRLYERCVWNKRTLSGLKTEDRELVFIGKGLNNKDATSPGGRKPQVLECATEGLAGVIAVLRALLSGQHIRAHHAAGIRLPQLTKLAARMQAAKYGVLVWEPAKLDFDHSEMVVQALCDMLKDLNTTTRFAGLTLAGNDGGIGAASVGAWLSGYPLRTSFENGYPEYDPTRYRCATQLASGETDVLVWISSIAGQPPPHFDGTTIVLGSPDMEDQDAHAVYIPVGTPGVDHAGLLIRCDSVVSLPARALRSSGLAEVAPTLDAIQQAL